METRLPGAKARTPEPEPTRVEEDKMKKPTMKTLTILCLGGIALAAGSGPGHLDDTFGLGGIVEHAVSGMDQAAIFGLAHQDGNILVAGQGTPDSSSSNNDVFLVGRFASGGTAQWVVQPFDPGFAS